MRHSLKVLGRIRYIVTGLIGLIVVLRYGSDEAQLLGSILIFWGVIGDITMNIEVHKRFEGDIYKANSISLQDKRKGGSLYVFSGEKQEAVAPAKRSVSSSVSKPASRPVGRPRKVVQA